MIKIDLNPPKKSLIQFGWIALFGFGLFALLARWKWGAPDWLVFGLAGLGVAMAVCAAAGASAPIRPVYVAMIVIAMPIGFVVSHALLGAIYYLLFTPVALFFRLRGKDPLDRRWDPAARTYWHARARQRTPSSYLRLY